jgi:hypothetical protein
MNLAWLKPKATSINIANENAGTATLPLRSLELQIRLSARSS